MQYAHTRVPAWFFDLLSELSESELKIILFIFRETLGWQRYSTYISYSQFTKVTGLTRASVSKALSTLQERQFFDREVKRYPAQLFTVFPERPVLPRKVVHNMNHTGINYEPVGNDDMNHFGSYYEPQVVHNMNSPIDTTKDSFKDNTTMSKFTPEQEESLVLLVGGGIEEKIARRLISLAWSRGRDISYIKRILGYVSSNPDVKNPAGMIVSLIERNNDRIRGSDGQQAPKYSLPVQKSHLYDDGGPELIKHSGPLNDCPICRAESED